MDFTNMTDAQIEELMEAAKKELSRRKKATTAAKKTHGLDAVRGTAENTLVRYMRGGVEVVGAFLKIGQAGTTATFLREGKKEVVQGHLILGTV